MRARLMTLHVDPDDMPAVASALETAVARFEQEDSYRGLLCLEESGLRNQLVIITLWDAAGLADTAHEADAAKELISAATDTGVTSRTYEVLRFVPHPPAGDPGAGDPGREADRSPTTTPTG